ncbi:MAG: glycosyltransferase [Rikenellaceae bacterium]
MTEKRLKIFVSAYACEPNMGSEIGVGWHWVMEMSKYFDLWVLTRQSNQSNIEEWLEKNKLENPPHFVYYDLPRKWRFWKKGLRGVRIYYLLWQRLSNGVVRKTMRQNNISIYHHLTYGNALWSVSRYGQRQTFIWGATSAGSFIERDFTRHYGFKNRIKEFAQRVIANTLPLNYGFRQRCKKAKLILCKTEQTRLSIPKKHQNKAVVFTDVAVELIDTKQHRAKENDHQITRYLAVGRLEAWRGFDLLIEAFAKAIKTDPKLHLDILGSGNDKKRLEAIISKHKIEDKVSLTGHLSRECYYEYMNQCDVVVNPTLKEGAVTTAFDSLSFKKPMICIETGGYTRYFDNRYAIVLQKKSRNQTITELSKAIIQLTSKTDREEKANEILSQRERFTWERKGEEIRDIILKTINE